MPTFFSHIYFIFCMVASMVPHSGGYMIPYAVLWKHGLSSVQEANVTMSSTSPPRLVVSSALSITIRLPFLAAMEMVGAQQQATWPTSTMSQEAIKAITVVPGVTGVYSLMLLVVIVALAFAIVWNVEAIVEIMNKVTFNGATTTRESTIASLTSEVNLLRGQLTAVSSEGSDVRGQLIQARVMADQANEALTVEILSRQRAETREAYERRERLCTAANAQAMIREYCQKVEELRALQARHDAESEDRIQTLINENNRLKAAIVVGENHTCQLEEKVRSLVASLEDAKKNTELLEDVGRSETRTPLIHNKTQEVHGSVHVFTRVRPFLPSDGAPDDAESVVVNTADGEGCVLSKHVFDAGKDYGHLTYSFKFDKCFPSSAGQEEVFSGVSEFVQSALDGFDVCLFSYGSNGSGKTHTMQGSGAGSMRGVIPRAMEQVGKYKETLEEHGWQYQMEVSFLEIYNETIKDLLRCGSSGQDIKHEIKRDRRGYTSVTGITKESVDPNDSTFIDEIIQRAACRRSVARTNTNEHSSRSHSVFTLYLKAINNSQRSELRGTLNLVDLAGSEHVGRSNAHGDRLNETKAINTSLSALRSVFVAIANKSSHIPFRNSKLTYLLQPALSGNGKALMMVNLSPAEESFRETLFSLQFAEQVKQCCTL